MQDQTKIPATAAVPSVPQEIAALLVNADAMLCVTADENGGINVRPVVPGKDYDPEHNPAHLLMAVITHEMPNLLSQAAGELTDSDRYQALRQFAQLASTDKERFEKINVALQEYEDKHKVNLAAAQDPETFDAYANFLADVLLVTHPDDESQQKKELVIPGSKIILPYR